MIKVGEKIKELRQREGRTQEALANETLKVLHGKAKLKEYTGKPVWNGIEE